MRNCIILFFILQTTIIQAQSISVQVVDSLTQDPISYATIYFSNNKGLITNEAGFFELLPEQIEANDSIFVSSLGYDGLAKVLKPWKDSILYLAPKTIELNNVILTNKNYTSEKIISLVKERMFQNYASDLSKKRLFYRKYDKQEIERLEVFKYKTSIKELNRALLDSFLINMPKVYDYTVETLCYYSGDFEEDNQKINLIKARNTYDKDDDIMTSLQDRLEKTLKDNVKSNSYFKVRSGFFGGKMDVEGLEKDVDSTDLEALRDFEAKRQEKKAKRQKNFAKYQKEGIASFYTKLFFAEDSELNCIEKPRRYIFSTPELTTRGEDLIYVIDFKPKGGEDFEGTLYINSEDFAVTRVDYSNVKGLFNFKLLGIFANKYLKSGKMIFAKGTNNKYSLTYLQVSEGMRFGIDRPLKFIEKNKFVKGRRKQNQISLKLSLEMTSISDYEIRVFENEPLTSTEYKAIEENNDVLPKYFSEFTTNFWEEF